MKVIVCTCVQCRAQKKNKSRNLKRRLRRYVSKISRRWESLKVKNIYWS